MNDRRAMAASMPAGLSPDIDAGVSPTASTALLTDLYELTMAAAYHKVGFDHQATFELTVRSLPAERRFLVTAGLDAALAGLENFRFSDNQLDYLRGLQQMPSDFLARLADLRFTGEVWAIPEGEVAFAGEPLVRVTAPLPEAQLVETFLLNRIASHTMVASKSARVALACGDRSFVDFSARRDHGADAAMAAARASWIAGSAGTSLLAAGERWDIPVSGTMAHSFVLSFDDERDAFRAYARTFPRGTVLLIDTYDTLDGARNAVEVAAELADEGIEIAGVRLDSGDLHRLSVRVRQVLDDAGLTDIRILASGDLDEYRIADLLARGAPIDAFGVGTQLGTSGDAPALGAVYKLVEDVRGPRMKLSSDKVTLPGRKQVWRCADYDVLGLDGEDVDAGRPLLQRVMADGTRLRSADDSLDAVRQRCHKALEALPASLRRLEPWQEDPWKVEWSAGLRDLIETVGAQYGRPNGGSPDSPTSVGSATSDTAKTSGI